MLNKGLLIEDIITLLEEDEATIKKVVDELNTKY